VNRRSTPSADTRSVSIPENPFRLGDRLKVGLRTLTPPVGVRIPLPQPFFKALFMQGFFYRWDTCLGHFSTKGLNHEVSQPPSIKAFNLLFQVENTQAPSR